MNKVIKNELVKALKQIIRFVSCNWVWEVTRYLLIKRGAIKKGPFKKAHFMQTSS